MSIAGVTGIDLNPVWSPCGGDGIAAFIEEFGSKSSCRIAHPAAGAHVRAKKHTPIYRAHSYHTKVPPQGIEPFIRHFSPRNGLVLDPFCGSGMTGVAALRAKRSAILIDLSPAATFIAANCCTSIDRKAFLAEAERIAAEMNHDFPDLYSTECAGCGRDAQITMTVFSVRYRCRHCSHEYVLWDVARGGRSVSRSYKCPACNRELKKSPQDLIDWHPVLVKYRCGRCGRGQKPPADADLARVEQLAEAALPDHLWCPDNPIPVEADEINRVHRSGIHTVADLFSPRNRLALAALWVKIGCVTDDTLRSRLAFAFTGTLPRASRTNKYIPSLGIAPGPLLGTMYIPGFYPEINVFELFRRKVADVSAAMALLPDLKRAKVRVVTQRATDLSNIPDGCVDYVFTDPPFGGNIQYSELNLLWESWLGHHTDAAFEAVISRTQGKGCSEYSELMQRSFGEMHRVLRKGGWLTLLFHNSSAKVWQGIQGALGAAGFEIESIGTFDKAHDTFKQITATGAVGFDVILHARRMNGRSLWASPGALKSTADNRLRDFLEDRLAGITKKPPIAHLRKLHSEALGHFVKAGVPVNFDFERFRSIMADVIGKEKIGTADER